jgi:hypothetical protein
MRAPASARSEGGAHEPTRPPLKHPDPSADPHHMSGRVQIVRQLAALTLAALRNSKR